MQTRNMQTKRAARLVDAAIIAVLIVMGVLIFTQDLRWVCRLHSPIHVVCAQRDPLCYTVDLTLPRLQLSNG